MRLAQIALHADDLNRAAAFYTTLLGAGPIGRFEPPGLLFFDLAGTRLLLEGAGPTGTIYLEVDDVAAHLDALREVATVLSEPRLIFTHEDDALGPAPTEEWQAFITDSEGNTIGLVELRPVGSRPAPERSVWVVLGRFAGVKRGRRWLSDGVRHLVNGVACPDDPAGRWGKA